MSPILFEAGTTQFDTLGLGVLSDVTSALVTEELNGEFTLTMEYKVGGKLSTEIKQNRILVVSSSPTAQRQAFMICKITKPIKGKFTVYAEHVSYLSYDMTLRPTQPITGDGGQALAAWKGMLTSTTPFSVWSDITTPNQTNFGMPEFENARQALGGHAGSIMDVWGGEYEFDNYAIRLHKQRGRAANTIVAYGRNLTDFTQEESILDTWTSIYPYATLMNGGESNESTTYYLDELVVDGEHVNDYPNRRAKPVDFSQEFKNASEFTQAKLRSLATSYMNNNNFGVPSVSITLSALDLAKATGYDTANGGDPETINLADTVNVYFDKIGVRTSAQVTRVVWNVLKESYDSYDLGAKKASLADSIKNQVNTAVDNSNKALTDTIQTIVSSDGRHNASFGDSSQGMPLNPKEGDIYFMEDGDDSYLYVAEVGEDGTVSWVLKTSTKSGEYINSAVDSAVSEATSHADSLNSTQASIANSISASTAAEFSSAAAARSSMASNASSMANSAAAKGSSAANSAYTAAMSGATAAVNALSSGVGAKITSTADSLNGKLATAITSANVTASSYATVARNEAVATASQNATAITSVAISNFGSQVASAYVKNTTFNQTVSDIQLAATQLQTQVNAMGQINQIFNTEFSPDWQGWYDGGSTESTTSYTDGVAPGSSWGIAGGKYDGSTVIRKQVSVLPNGIHTGLIQVGAQTPITASIWQYSSSDFNGTVTGAIYLKYYDSNKRYIGRSNFDSGKFTNWQKWVASTTTPINTAYVSFNIITNGGTGYNYYAKPMLVFESTIGDYVPGNYNNNARVSSLELDVDGITGVVNDPSKGLSATWNLANDGQTLAVQASNAATTALTTAQGVQTTVANFQLGTQNYIVDGGFETGNGHGLTPVTQTATYPKPFGDYMGRVYDGTSASGADIINYFTLPKPVTIKAGEKWTMSYYYATATAAMGQASDYAYGDDGQPVYGVMMEHANHVTTGGQQVWQRYTKTFTLTVDKTITRLRFGFIKNSSAGGWKVIDNIQLERGNMVSDWHQAPEDTDNAIQSVKTQLADQITTEVTNRSNGDATTVTQMTNLINQQVQSVTTGYQTALTQTSNALIARIASLNLVNNSGFEYVNDNQLQGWHRDNAWGSTLTYNSGFYIHEQNPDGTISIRHDYAKDTAWIYSDPIPTRENANFAGSIEIVEGNGWNTNSQIPFALDIKYYDANRNAINNLRINYAGTTIGAAWPRKSFTLTTPANTRYIAFGMCWNGGSIAFRRPALYAGSTDYGYIPGAKMGAQTTLQLFEDSFLLGIKDNIGNIISGINGDTSGVTITGKKITLDSSVTVTADFYAKGGNFKNLNASNMTVGTLNGANVNMINLNAGNITSGNLNAAVVKIVGTKSQLSMNGSGLTLSSTDSSKPWVTTFNDSGVNFTMNTFGSESENIGGIKSLSADGDSRINGIYFALNKYGTPGKNFGGDEIGFAYSTGTASDGSANYTAAMLYNATGGGGKLTGFHFYDRMFFHGNDLNVTGSQFFIDGATNQLKMQWISWSNWFNGQKNPTIVASNGGWNGAGIAFGYDNVVVFSTGGGAKTLL